MNEAARSNDQELMNVAGWDSETVADLPKPSGSEATTDRAVAGSPGAAGGLGQRWRGLIGARRGGLDGSPDGGPDGADVTVVGSGAGSPGRARSGGPAGGAHSADGNDVDLGDDPFDDDLASQLKARVPLKLTSRTTLSLAGAVLIVFGFLGGVLVQKKFGATATPAAAARTGFGANAANGAGAGAAGGAGTGATGAGRGTTGTVKFVDGTTIYLTTADGQTVTVKTSSSTTVVVQQSSAAKDIPVGATIVVQGAADANGIVTATTVTAQK
jgi:hypothetical protein